MEQNDSKRIEIPSNSELNEAIFSILSDCNENFV